MKPTTQDQPRRRRLAVDPPPKAGRSDSAYISLDATRALLLGSLEARTERLDASDMLSTDEAADLVGTTRVTINAWIAKGRCIGLAQTKRGFKVPRWQFEPAVWATIPRLSDALGTTDGWAMLAFLESPHGGLRGMTPLAALERGQVQRILNLADQDGN